MPARMIRDALLDSDRWLALPDNSSRLAFVALILRADDLGNVEANPARLCRWWRDFGIDNKEKVASVLMALSDAGLIILYVERIDKRPCLHIPRFRQRLRHYRHVIPVPLWQEEEYQRLTRKTPDERQSDAGRTSGDRRPEVEVEVEVEVVGTVESSAAIPKNGIGSNQLANEILNFLNDKTGRHFRPVKANLDPILARIKEGATQRDLQAVIARKCRDWSADDKMRPYLRPATLFNATKFAQYVGEVPPPKDLLP